MVNKHKYIYIYIYIYIHKHIHTCVYINTYNTFTYIYVYINTYVYTYQQKDNLYVPQNKGNQPPNAQHTDWTHVESSERTHSTSCAFRRSSICAPENGQFNLLECPPDHDWLHGGATHPNTCVCVCIPICIH